MPNPPSRTICWTPLWNKAHEGVGLEHLVFSERSADSVVLAIDEEHGPLRLVYHLSWDDTWQLRDAELSIITVGADPNLTHRADRILTRGWKLAA